MIRLSWFLKSGASTLLALFFALPAQAAFTVNSDGTVSDTVTGLTWDQCSWGLSGASCATGAATLHTWTQALGVAITANSASYKSHNDWRLPNMNELESLVKIDAVSPAIDIAAFPNTMTGWYWSSTSYASAPAYAWDVNLVYGDTSAFNKTDNNYVRLVRSGQLFDSFDSLAAATTPAAVPAQMGINNTTADSDDVSPGGFTRIGNPVRITFDFPGCSGAELHLVMSAPGIGLPWSYLDNTLQWRTLPGDLGQITPFVGSYPSTSSLLYYGYLPPSTYDVYLVCDSRNGHLDIQNLATGPALGGMYTHRRFKVE